MQSSYGYSTVLKGASFEDAITRVTAALKEQGFGVLTEIDVKATLKKKIDVDFRRYTILGACNPRLAHAALTADPHIGLLLPCNVIVYERDDGDTVVSLANPRAMFKIAENRDLATIMDEADSRIRSVCQHLGGEECKD